MKKNFKLQKTIGDSLHIYEQQYKKKKKPVMICFAFCNFVFLISGFSAVCWECSRKK